MRSLSLALLPGVVGAVTIPAAASGQTTPPSSVLNGIYTEEKAIRGQSLYNDGCLECHGETMTGLDQAPPLAGPQFSGTWDGEPLWALVGRIGLMPPDKAGSLSPSENVDLLSYILWYNGLPFGEVPLASEQSVLEKITFQTSPLPSR